MNTNSRLSKLRSKKVLIPAIAVVVLGAAGTGIAVAMDDESGHRDVTLTGTEATKVGDAAKKAAALPEAVVVKVERDDEDGVTSYEVTLDNPTGGRYEVELNSALGLIEVDSESEDHNERGDHGERGERDDSPASTRTVNGVLVDEEEGAISDANLAQVIKAAQLKVPGSKVVEVASNKPDNDDTGLDAQEAYSVDLSTGSGATLIEHEVDLDATFKVLRTSVE